MIKMRILLFFLFTIFSSPINLYAITAEELLDKVDLVQRDYDSLYFEAVMEIISGSRQLSKDYYGYLDDKDSKSFMEFTNPQDQGTRYLKINTDLWIYLPDAQDTIKISGHLLRDGVMGSDISYDDILNQGAYNKEYTSESLETVELDGMQVYKLTILAINDAVVSYAKQDLYVDMDSFQIYKVTLYAKGRKGYRAIKEFKLKDYQKVGKLTMPMISEVSDLRKKNSLTRVTYTKLKPDIKLDKKMFTRSYLEN